MRPTQSLSARSSSMLRALLLALALCLGAAPFAARAQEEVAPTDRVKSNVVVRAEPSTDSPAIGVLRPGERLQLDEAVPFWNEVILPDGRTGYVSKAWTRIVPAAGAGDFTIHTVDVGTGLAVVVFGPDFTLVYDGGSNDDLARGPKGNRLWAYLRKVRPNLTTIDHLILSHPHRDHVELLPDLFGAYQINHVWDSGRVHPICGYRLFLEAIIAEPDVAYHDALGDRTRAVPFDKKTCYGVKKPKETLVLTQAARINGMPVELGATGAQMTFLYFDATGHGDPNENTLVVRLDLGGVRVLLMGDAEAGTRQRPTAAPDPGSVEARLLACCKAALKAHILFAGHHGSETSSRTAFLDAVGAKTSIISSGPYRYSGVRLPDDTVVTVLAARGEVWRTDLNDTACAVATAKVGRDKDGEAGGCDNILVTIANGAATTEYKRLSD